MALTGELIWKGLTLPNAYVRVMNVRHSVVDISTANVEENGDTIWSKVLNADYSVRVYSTAEAYAANPDAAIYTVSGAFIPSVANGANLNIVKQTYLHLKTLDTYKDLTDC